MRLSKSEIGNFKNGIRLPGFDIDEMRAKTAKEPEWVHFGAGNIFRGFIGSIAQKLLNSGEMSTGIIAVESFDHDIIDKIYAPYDNLTLNVLTGADGEADIEVLAGIAEGIKTDSMDRLIEIAEAESLKMLSFTITEKGYALKNADGEYFAVVAEDIEKGPGAPKHVMSVVAAMLYRRYKAGAMPVAVVSMDNCSHNGEKLAASVKEIAAAWCDRGHCDSGFTDYLEKKVSFPWSMIDKITPRPADSIKKMLEDKGISDIDPIITSKNTYIAPYVNAERPEYLVIEDSFPNGRPPLEKAGVYMTDRETVNKAETMKVTTCLNPLHTGLAVYGCLLGYTAIWQEMRDKELSKLVNMIADEGMKVVIDPKIIDPRAFVDEVINERLTNPNIPDAPQRIATDTSQKVGIRYGETIKAYVKSDKLNASDLKAIPMAIAGWLRYLLGVDDNLQSFELSSDPMLSELKAALEGVEADKRESVHSKLSKILSNERIFGTDLYKAGIGEKIEGYFMSLASGKGAVRETLKSL